MIRLSWRTPLLYLPALALLIASSGLTACGERQILSDPEEPPAQQGEPS